MRMAGTIVCFGELLLRLGAPARERLLQRPSFEVHVGGAEANVAVQLARLGNAAAYVGVVSANPLGDAALGELRRHGVDTTRALRRAGRMGLYFLETGAGQRPSEVLYDRADSAFATARASAYDWAGLLDGATALHVSGVTPALGAEAAAAATAALTAARARGIATSFDGNFRAKLWAASGGDAPAILRELFALADTAFADPRDLGVALGRSFEGSNDTARRAAARAAFDVFPRLARIATTVRAQRSVDDHTLGAVLDERDGARHTAPPVALAPIVDRIGAGDAFAAGVLHVLARGGDGADALRHGHAAACLKHATPGDAGLARADELRAFVEDRRYDVRR